MADIYAKAALTVAASASQDSKGGCFRTTPELSGSNSWEIAVEYRALVDGPAESPALGDSIDADRQSEDNRWLYDDEMSAYWEQCISGGQARSIFGASNERFSVMRYLPGQAPPASLPSNCPAVNAIPQKPVRSTKAEIQMTEIGQARRRNLRISVGSLKN